MMTEVERLRVQVDAMERVIVEQRRQLAGFIAGEAIPAHIAGSAFGGLKHAVCAGVKHLKSVLGSTPERDVNKRRVLEGQIAVANAWNCFLIALTGGTPTECVYRTPKAALDVVMANPPVGTIAGDRPLDEMLMRKIGASAASEGGEE
jgi:hypothetical protein